jgi:hypothetical protein
VAGVPSRIQAGRARRALHRSGDAPIAEPLGQQPAVTVEGDERGRRGAAADAQRQPGAQRPDRARRGARAEGDAFQRALARPVGLAPPNRDDRAVGGPLHVADVEGDELAPTDGAGDAHEQQRPVPDTGRASTTRRSSAVTAAASPSGAVPCVRRIPVRTSRTAWSWVGEAWPAVLWACAIALTRCWIVEAFRSPPSRARPSAPVDGAAGGASRPGPVHQAVTSAQQRRWARMVFSAFDAAASSRAGSATSARRARAAGPGRAIGARARASATALSLPPPAPEARLGRVPLPAHPTGGGHERLLEVHRRGRVRGPPERHPPHQEPRRRLVSAAGRDQRLTGHP